MEQQNYMLSKWFMKTCESGKRLGGLHCWRRICRQKVTVRALTPFDRIAPTGNCGTPRTGNASEDWQRLR